MSEKVLEEPEISRNRALFGYELKALRDWSRHIRGHLAEVSRGLDQLDIWIERCAQTADETLKDCGDYGPGDGVER